MNRMNLKRYLTIGICSAALMLPLSGMAQAAGASAAASAGAAVSPGESLNVILTLMEKQIVSAADAMPADKFDFVPPATGIVPTGGGDFKGVSSFSAQVKHLASENYAFFKGWGIPGEVDPKTITALKSKDEIMKALRDSYTFAHAAVASITPENAFTSLGGPPERKATRVSTATFCMAHSMDHYGQLVEYLRMNGIIPPASRKSTTTSGM
jgi:hypothetical protein